MSFWNLVLRGITYYWRWHVGLLLGVAITSAIVSGSLIVGDSVKATLKRQNEVRLGKVAHALVGGDRFFTEALVDSLSAKYGERAQLTGLLVLRGTVSAASGGKRINNVNVIGVKPEFWSLGLEGGNLPSGLLVNEPLATGYDLAVGDTLIVRVEKPSPLSRDAPLSGSKEDLAALRQEIAGTVAPEHGGNFSLRTEQLPPLNVFVPLAELQKLVEEQDRLNLMVANDFEGSENLAADLQDAWELADAELALESIDNGNRWNVSSPRVFIDPAIESAIEEIESESAEVATYLVNQISQGDHITPYSMATALPRGYRDILPEDTGENEILVNQWLADDMGLKGGETVALKYFVLSEGTLKEEAYTMVVKAVLPMNHPAMNPTWTPEFPGVSEEDNCSDWDTGHEVDLNLIREKDETYWDDYKATPKVFLPIETGRKLWSNRFGNVTGIQFGSSETDEAQFLTKLKGKLTVADIGLNLVDTKSAAESAVAQALPLEQYFLSFGFFLILTALVLAALLFLFSMENRSAQIGVLSAVGIPQQTVRRLFLVEGLGISVLGALTGLGGGILYTKLILAGLSGGWSEAVAGLNFDFAMKPVSLVLAFFGTVFMALATVYVSSRRILKAQPKDLLAGSGVPPRPWDKWTRRLVWMGLIWWGISTVGAIGYLTMSTDASMGLWFLAGATLLTLGLIVTGSILRRAGNKVSVDGHVSLWQMGLRNAVRKPGRSLAITGILAAGIFMMTVVNLFRQDANRDATERSAGTGGFAFVGESAMAIYEDLNTAAGRDAYSIDAAEMDGATVVHFRVQEGDEASCLNLNHAQVPAVVGVAPGELAGRFTFAGVFDDVTLPGEASPWEALNAELPDGAVPAIMDMNSATYALKVKLGETIPYTDTNGNSVPLVLVGLLSNSLLQGKVIISEDRFKNHFRDTAGYRYFLVDAESSKADTLSETLTKQLGVRGLSLTPAPVRLGQFNAVQNTYIGIFSTLGAFALVLSTAGLGILVARNVLERRAEFGILQAVGFRKPALRKIVLGEHWFLLLAGLFIGLVSAIIAVWPMLGTAGSTGISAGFVSFLFLGILAGGLAFCWIAASLALRLPLLDAIRKE
jgi:putative ABC transport system permease protein